MTWLGDKVDKADNPGAPAATARAIGASFQPSATKYTLAQYTIQQTETTGQDGTVKLLSDAVDPPTTERAQLRCKNANAADHIACNQLTYLVPPGHYVKLVASGTGVNAITQQVETVIS